MPDLPGWAYFSGLLVVMRWNVQQWIFQWLACSEVEGAAVDANAALAVHILVNLYCLFRANMHWLHKLPRAVSANGNAAQVEGAQTRSNVTEHWAVSGVT
jgi:hypothetical protein